MCNNCSAAPLPPLARARRNGAADAPGKLAATAKLLSKRRRERTTWWQLSAGASARPGANDAWSARPARSTSAPVRRAAGCVPPTSAPPHCPHRTSTPLASCLIPARRTPLAQTGACCHAGPPPSLQGDPGPMLARPAGAAAHPCRASLAPCPASRRARQDAAPNLGGGRTWGGAPRKWGGVPWTRQCTGRGRRGGTVAAAAAWGASPGRGWGAVGRGRGWGRMDTAPRPGTAARWEASAPGGRTASAASVALASLTALQTTPTREEASASAASVAAASPTAPRRPCRASRAAASRRAAHPPWAAAPQPAAQLLRAAVGPTTAE